MTGQFRNFKNKATGQIVRLPAHYETLFADSLELTDEDVECVDCNTPDAPDLEADNEPTEVSAEVPMTLAITEPAKRSTRRNRNQ